MPEVPEQLEGETDKDWVIRARDALYPPLNPSKARKAAADLIEYYRPHDFGSADPMIGAFIMAAARLALEDDIFASQIAATMNDGAGD